MLLEVDLSTKNRFRHKMIRTACAITASVVGLAVSGCLVARASGDGPAINGTLTATSNGQWAQTNEVYHDQATVRSTWTIRTTCANALSCSGTVTSDQGWTADIYTTNYLWYVKRDVPNWQPCADGTSAPGHQVFDFYAVAADGTLDPNSTTYAGKDLTSGPSGGCGRSQPLVISMPFKLVKVS